MSCAGTSRKQVLVQHLEKRPVGNDPARRPERGRRGADQLVPDGGLPGPRRRDRRELADAGGPYREQLEDTFFLLPGGRLALVGLDYTHAHNLARSTFSTAARAANGSPRWQRRSKPRLDSRQVFDSQCPLRLPPPRRDPRPAGARPRSDSASSGVAADGGGPPALFGVTQFSSLALEPGEESLLVADTPGGIVRRFRRGCGSWPAGPCLADRRFRTEVIWRTARRAGVPGPPLSRSAPVDSQVFSFFDTANWEVLAKVLDGCADQRPFLGLRRGLDRSRLRPPGQRHLDRPAPRATTTPAAPPAPALTDTDAFATCDAPSPGWNPPAQERDPLVENANGTAPRLQLRSQYELDHRRRATGRPERGSKRSRRRPPASSTSSPRQLGNAGQGARRLRHQRLPLGLRRRHHPDVGYKLEVTERTSGRRKVYTNPVGTPARAITDIAAFSCNAEARPAVPVRKSEPPLELPPSASAQ